MAKTPKTPQPPLPLFAPPPGPADKYLPGRRQVAPPPPPPSIDDRPADLPQPPRRYTVAELTERLKRNLKAAFCDLTVVGEVGSLTQSGAGHLYLSLKDQDQDARLDCVMFRGQAALLPRSPRQGEMVAVQGDLDIYAPRGSYQMVVRTLRFEGEGQLREALEILKARLASEGLFDQSRKRPLPRTPACVGVVTSPTGAALTDLRTVMAGRMPSIRLKLVPCLVQGELAPQQIVDALTRLYHEPGVEVIVLTRGGGSLEDLMAFNHEAVVRAVAKSPVPLVSAVGHEIDFSLCDLAADVRAATPSHAGELLAPDRRELLAALGHLKRRMEHLGQAHLERRLAALMACKSTLSRPPSALTTALLTLDHLAQRNLYALRQHHDLAARRLERAAAALARQSPQRRAAEQARRLAEMSQRMQQAMAGHLGSGNTRLQQAGASLRALDPLAVLSRGYSVVMDADGHAVTDAASLTPGQSLDLLFSQGGAEATVKRTTRRCGQERGKH